MTNFDNPFDRKKDGFDKPTTNESSESYSIRKGDVRQDRPPIENPQDVIENRPSPKQRKDIEE
jgi:hypothetical protein